MPIALLAPAMSSSFYNPSFAFSSHFDPGESARAAPSEAALRLRLPPHLSSHCRHDAAGATVSHFAWKLTPSLP